MKTKLNSHSKKHSHKSFSRITLLAKNNLLKKVLLNKMSIKDVLYLFTSGFTLN